MHDGDAGQRLPRLGWHGPGIEEWFKGCPRPVVQYPARRPVGNSVDAPAGKDPVIAVELRGIQPDVRAGHTQEHARRSVEC